MYGVAVVLRAHVQGEECELYGPDGEALPPHGASEPAVPKRRPWWRFWS
jgi:hypothetical protein